MKVSQSGTFQELVVPTVMHGGGVMVWGALLVTLSVIYLEFKAHLTSMATTAFPRRGVMSAASDALASIIP